MTPAELAAVFSMHGAADREGHLLALKIPRSLSVADAAKHHAYSRALHNTHERMRRAGR
jgi:hypothetical protein